MCTLVFLMNRWTRVVRNSCNSLLGACLLVGMSVAHATDAPQGWLSFSKDQAIPASVTLLPFDGKVGRSKPFFSGYRPQLRFAAGKRDVLCAVSIVPPKEKVEPGDTADVTLRCREDFKVLDKDLAFVVIEGGRQVAEGLLKP